MERIERIESEAMAWQPSPAEGVWRKRLEHIGGAESGRVTSIVRYDPGSRFPPHPHPEGEEILVLEGTFADEHGSYPAGSYLLNPEGHVHAPRTAEGCVLFVKLRQYPGERRQVNLAPDEPAFEAHPKHSGVSVRRLYEAPGREAMRLVRFAPGASVPLQHFEGGEEILVLSGELRDEHGVHPRGTWLRFSPGTGHAPSSELGCLLYVKKGHLGAGN